MKNTTKLNDKVKSYATRRTILILFMYVLIISCGKQNDLPSYNPPTDHTKSENGVMHKSGLNQPNNNCTSCHGADLKGGTSGVSCFSCHGQKWN